MRASTWWHARTRSSRARRTRALIAVTALLLSAAAVPAGDAARGDAGDDGPDAVEVRIPSNQELVELLADEDARVVGSRRARAADGAIGAGVEITPSGYGPTWLGAYGPPAGAAGLAWCVQARIYPSTGDAPVGAVPVEDRPLAYAEDVHADPGNAAVQAALGYLVHMRHEQPGTMAGGDVARTRALIDAATPAVIKDVAASLIADGDRHAGPYSPPSAGVEELDLRFGEIRRLGVLSAAGAYVAGASGTVTLTEYDAASRSWVPTDKAVFDVDGNRRADPGESGTWRGSSESVGLTLAYVAARGAGPIRFEARWTGVRASRGYARYDMGGRRQDVLVLGGGAPGGDPVEYVGPPFTVAADFQLVPTSQVSSYSVEKGETVTDVLTTTLAAGDTWAEVDGARVPMRARATVYGPLPGRLTPSATPPAGTPVAETRRVDVAGPGATEHDFTFASGGTYAIRWSFLKADQGANAAFLRADASDDFMAPTETFHVKVDVALSSEVDERWADDDGAGLRDRVSVALGDGDVWPADDAGRPLTLRVRNTAYAPTGVPSAEAATAPPGTEVLTTEFLEFTAPGWQATGLVSTGGAHGFVTWQAEVRMADQSAAMAARLSGPVRSAWMEEAETTSVRRPLEHASEMREWNVDLDGRAFDEVTVSGFPDDHGDFAGVGGWGADLDTSTFTVFGPVPDGDPWWDDPVVTDGLPVLMATELPARNGTYRVGYTDDDRIQPHLPGCYVAQWTFDGDDRVQPFASRLDDVLERFCVRADPSLWLDMVSTASQSATAGEGAVGDTVLVLGPAFPADGAELAWEQCLWAPGEDPGCAEPVVTHTADVPRTGAYLHPDVPTPTIEDLPPGTLEAFVGWAPVLRDRDGTELLREPWGTASQTTHVVADLPEMASTATPAAGPGDVVTDQVVLTGATRADWTLHWELCWLDEDGGCPDGTAVAAGDPVPVDPTVSVYDAPPRVVAVPEGTAPGARLRLGWAPVLTDALGAELLREGWGVAAQTTTVDHPLPELTSRATPAGEVGADGSVDRVEITGPLLDGSVVVWEACYWVAGDTGCRPDAAAVEPGPVLVPEVEPVGGPDGTWLPGPDPRVGIVLPALGVGERTTVTGPEHALTDGGLPPHPGLRLSWLPRILSPDGEVVLAETWGVASQTTTVTFPPITTVTEAYADSDDGPWYGDSIGDRLTIRGDVFPAEVVGDAGHEPDTVTVRLYAWPADGPPVCAGEPLAEHEVGLRPGVAEYDTGPLYETPVDRTDLVYGFQETTRSRGVETVSECGLAAETLRPGVRPEVPAPPLAVTGARAGALAGGTVVLLAVGGALVVYRRTLARNLAAMGSGVPGS